jgi:hypothetical protein
MSARDATNCRHYNGNASKEFSEDSHAASFKQELLTLKERTACGT